MFLGQGRSTPTTKKLTYARSEKGRNYTIHPDNILEQSQINPKYTSQKISLTKILQHGNSINVFAKRKLTFDQKMGAMVQFTLIMLQNKYLGQLYSVSYFRFIVRKSTSCLPLEQKISRGNDPVYRDQHRRQQSNTIVHVGQQLSGQLKGW